MRKLRQERHRQTNPPPKVAAIRELVDEVRELVSETKADRQAVAKLTEQVTALSNEVREFRHRVWDHQGSRPPRRMRRLAAAIQGWKSPAAAQPHQILPPVDVDADSRRAQRPGADLGEYDHRRTDEITGTSNPTLIPPETKERGNEQIPG